MQEKIYVLAGKGYPLRRYEISLRFAGPVERLLYHLAHFMADDYINPKDWSWAVLILDPADGIEEFLNDFYPPLTESELGFIKALKGAIIKTGSKKVEVDFYSNEADIRAAWKEMKKEAQLERT